MPARSLSVRFSFLRYSSNANFDVITPVASRILEISAAADPCGMFTVIISKFVSDKLSSISLLSIELAELETRLYTAYIEITVINN